MHAAIVKTLRTTATLAIDELAVAHRRPHVLQKEGPHRRHSEHVAQGFAARNERVHSSASSTWTISQVNET